MDSFTQTFNTQPHTSVYSIFSFGIRVRVGEEEAKRVAGLDPVIRLHIYIYIFGIRVRWGEDEVKRV